MAARSRRFLLVVVAAGLLALLAVLATLQYRWLGQVSEAERERLLHNAQARAEAFARAKVDSVAQAQLAVLRARADSLRGEGARRYEEARARLEAERAKLNDQLTRLGVGALGDVLPMPKLPGIPGLPGQERDTAAPDSAAADSGSGPPGE